MVNGWTIDLNYGIWTGHSLDDCKNWYGWMYGNPGSISTTFSGVGRARLDFGNCFWNEGKGTVKVFLDELEIGSTDASIRKTVEFNFNSGSVLKITEDEGAIEFNSLQVICPAKVDGKGVLSDTNTAHIVLN